MKDGQEELDKGEKELEEEKRISVPFNQYREE